MSVSSSTSVVTSNPVEAGKANAASESKKVAKYDTLAFKVRSLATRISNLFYSFVAMIVEFLRKHNVISDKKAAKHAETPSAKNLQMALLQEFNAIAEANKPIGKKASEGQVVVQKVLVDLPEGKKGPQVQVERELVIDNSSFAQKFFANRKGVKLPGEHVQPKVEGLFKDQIGVAKNPRSIWNAWGLFTSRNYTQKI